MRITVLSAGAACETKSSSLHQQTSRVLRKTEPGKRACELLTHFSEQALISVYCRNHYASSFFFSLPVATKVNKPHQREPREPTASSKNCTAERTMKCGWCLGLWGLLNTNMTFQLKGVRVYYKRRTWHEKHISSHSLIDFFGACFIRNAWQNRQ